jgi:hypothetical protein
VTWYQPRPDYTAGAMDDPQNDRVTFINSPTSGNSATYRHVLLVEPLASGLCFSGVTVNRSASPASLISYEYRTKDEMTAAKVGARIVHWPLDASTGLLARATDGKVHSGKLYVTPTYQVQGVSVDHASFFFSTSQSGGTFYREVDGDGVAPDQSTWVEGAETVSFTTTSFGDRLWSVTETPGRRMVFWVYTSEMK